MKAIMISIRPEWVCKILNGEKTIEIRKTEPKCELPVKVYIYCTKNNGKGVGKYPFYQFCDNKLNDLNGKVVAEFTLKNISYWQPYWTPEVMHICDISEKSCVSTEYLVQYCGDGIIYAWHIEDLKIYDKPKELSEFTRKYCGNCKHIASHKKPLSDCDRHCSKYNQNLLFYDWFNKCEDCIKNTRPPQSWCYCEELEEV